MDEQSTRSAALAALEGTAEDLLFIGGQYHGQVKSVSPEDSVVYAQYVRMDSEIGRMTRYLEMYRRFRLASGSDERFVMIERGHTNAMKAVTGFLLDEFVRKGPRNG